MHLFGVLLLVGIGIFIGKTLGDEAQAPPTWNDTAIKQISKHGLVELTRRWSKTIEDDEGFGKGIIEYHWHFKYLFGIDVPNDWDWKISRDNGKISVYAPPLTLLNEPQFSLDNKIEFNQANGNRQQRMDEKAKEIAENAIKLAVISLTKKESLVYKHAKLSLQDYLLNLINQANPKAPSQKLIVNFSH